MGNDKVIDLEMCEDGTYVEKKNKASKTSKPSKPSKTICTKTKTNNSKNNTDEFLGGIDTGLEFIESVIPRVSRLLKLRG